MTRTLRRISQVLFFGLFLYLVYHTTYPIKSALPVDFLMKLDPLVGLTSMLASKSIIHNAVIPFIFLIATTILLGRVFCGWICPMGTTLDGSDKVFFRGKHNRNPVRLSWLKYCVLAGILVAAVFGVQAVYFLDPLSLITRTTVLAFVAPFQLAMREISQLLYAWSGSSFGPLAHVSMWLSDRMINWPFIAGPKLYFREAFGVLAIFVGIVSLNSMSRRFWCKNLCPLGALLGLFSRVPALKRVVNNDCIDCGKCVRDCKMTAIPHNPRLTRSQECIECFNCTPICPKDAVSFGVRPKPVFHEETALSLPRRRVLQGAGVGLAFAAMAGIDPARKRALSDTSTIKLSSNRLIRPPGSVVENDFVEKCVRCGLCMKTCPTNGLQPALHEAGIEGFWTPILVPSIGCCTQECNACGQVCPTKAIEKFEIADKNRIFIGTAVIERDHCIAWNSGKKCLVCDEYCSYKAIEWKVDNGVRRPFVNDEKCVGCGICESACPIQPVAAIRVFSFGDKRGQKLAPKPPSSSPANDGSGSDNPYPG